MTTILGFILAIISIVLGMVLKGANPAALMNSAAIVVIIVGTIAALLNSYPFEDVKKIPKLFKILYSNKNYYNKIELIKQFTTWSNTIRTEGVLAIDNEIESIEDDFLKKGMQMLVDGLENEVIEDRLGTDLDNMIDRHENNASMFSKAGEYAPALGVLGAVLGLVSALGNLDDMAVLGQSIAASFIATLYGIATGYLFWIPYANQLKQISNEEVNAKEMIIEGILALRENFNQRMIEETLLTYLSDKERNEYLKVKDNEEK